MMSPKLLSGVAALTLALAMPTASFAFGRGGWGGGHMGGGGGMHMGGGGMRMGGAPGGMRVGGVAPAARFAGTNGGNWNGGRSAWNGNGGWHGGDFHHRRFFPGAVAGAVIGGAIAADSYAYYGGPDYDYGPGYYDNTYYDNGYDDGAAVAVVPDQGADPSYCAQRYRSYDPASGTYLGFDGLRHPCGQ